MSDWEDVPSGEWEDVSSNQWEDVPADPAPQESDDGWLDYLGSLSSALPKKILSGILDAEAGLAASAADRKRNYTEDFYQAPDVPLSADPLTMARMGFIPEPSRPAEDRAVVSSARATAKDLSESVDRDLGLDPNGLPKRALDITGQLAPAVGASVLSPYLMPFMIGGQTYAQKYNALDQMVDESGQPLLTPEQKSLDAGLSGGLGAVASLAPMSVLGTSQGPFLSRMAQEYLKQAAVNGVINPVQTVGEAVIDSQVAGIPTSPQELADRVGTSVGDAWLMAAPFALAGATGARRPQAPAPKTDADFNQTYIEGPYTRIGPRSVIDQERPRSVLWDRSYLSERPMQTEIPLADGPAPAIGDIVPVQDPSIVGPEEGFSALDPLAQAVDAPPVEGAPSQAPQAPEGFSVLDPLSKAADDTVPVEALPVPPEPVSGFRSFDALKAQEPTRTEPVKASTEEAAFADSPATTVQKASQGDARPAPQAEELPQAAVPEQAPQTDSSPAVDLNTVEVPVASLQLSRDVPQFKRGANARGVVEPLQGKYDRRSTPPIAVWRRKDGRLEVISGRHRLDLAQRTGEETIPAQIYDESAGFTVNDAVTLDAEINIRDQSAKVYDMANYYRRIKIDPAEAEKRGMLSREDQRMGYDIGNNATDETFKLYENEKLNDRQAALIARTAPGDATLQSTGAKAALKGEPLDYIRARMRVATKADRVPELEQTELFKGMESVARVERLQDAEANVIVREQRALSERINTIRGAARRPEIARQEGLPPDDPVALAQRVKDLELQRAKLNDIHLYPELHSQVTEQAIRDLNGGAPEADAVSRSIQAKTGNLEFSPERANFDPFWFINIFRRADNPLEHDGLSDSNKAYGRGLKAFWNNRLQFMTTTLAKMPQAKRYIEAWWGQPQFESAVVHDLSLSLKPYTEGITKAERQTVDNYLAWARVKGKDGYRISRLAAERAGLTSAQAEAAVAANKTMNDSLNILERRAIESAHHDHWERLQNISSDEGRGRAQADLDEQIKEISQRFNDMRGYNYVPFSRFGNSYVKVVSPDGETLFRAEYEKNDGNLQRGKAHLRQLTRDPNNPLYGGIVLSGDNPPPKLRKSDGVPADLIDLMHSPQDGTPIRGFPKHLQNAALIPGQSADMGRNMSEYILGLAKMVSMQKADQTAKRAMVEDMHPIDDRNLQRKLVEWSSTFTDQKNWKSVHDLFNLGYIWGNVRVPFSDLIGRATLQYPLLGKYAGPIKSQAIALKGLAKEAAWWVNPKAVGADLSSAIEDAQRRGIIPTSTHRKMARMAQGEKSLIGKSLSTAYDAGFKFKELTEASSRVGAFIWGWEAFPTWAKGQGKGTKMTRQEFAEQFVREGQAVPTQLELPPNAIFKSELGRLSTKFRMFQVKIAKTLLENAGSPGFVTNFALATLLATGVKGLPGYRDFANLVYDPEKDLRAAGARTAVMNGLLSEKMGVDLSGTAGFGEIVPSSGDAMSRFILGVGGAPFQQVGKSIDEFKKGHPLKGAASLPFMPGYVKESFNVADWASRGVTSGDGTTLIPKDQVTPGMAFRKFLGWNPIEVANKQTMYRMIRTDAKSNPDATIMNKRIGEARAAGDIEEANKLIQLANQEGIKLSKRSIETAEDKARGQITGIPKDMAAEARRIMGLFD